jgi:hypothetical protein
MLYGNCNKTGLSDINIKHEPDNKQWKVCKLQQGITWQGIIGYGF